ncbi:MAG: phosphotransferase [Gammaproteobacteria bacterium]|nr:phosphotransferase [Gammaproteobacteria bacterium]
MPAAAPADDRALQRFLDEYEAGAVLGCDRVPAPSGDENYLIATERGAYVITLFAADATAPKLDLADLLTRQRIPCPRPLRNITGGRSGTLSGRSAVLSIRGRGQLRTRAGVSDCAAVGTMLARIHIAGRSDPPPLMEKPRAQGWRDLAAGVRTRVGRDDERLIAGELAFQSLYRFSDLPRGTIHSCPVRAVVLFEEGRVTSLVGVPGFRADVLLYDLAVAVNDWCSRDDGGLDGQLAGATLDAYHAHRPLSALERGAWPVLLRAAALHSWLRALYDAHTSRSQCGPSGADPEALGRILRQRIDNESMARAVWPACRPYGSVG